MTEYQNIIEMLAGIQEQTVSIQSRMDGIQNRVDGIQEQMVSIQSRVDGIQNRVDDIQEQMDEKFDMLEKFAVSIDREIKDVKNLAGETSANLVSNERYIIGRVNVLEENVNDHETRIKDLEFKKIS